MKYLNLVALRGQLAAPPEVRVFESGTRLVRYLLTVRSEEPRRRVDVLPVTMWDPPDAVLESMPETGAALWVSGSVQRRFWEGADGRRSRLELIASNIAPDVEGVLRH
jgi:single-stranded DNA-binding protein